MDNNLFQYATSELSQDAFICWLLSYAMKGCDKDAVLSACAKEFLRFFVPDLENEEVYLSEPPRRQYKSVDVLITVNDKYKVIIEDKTHTSDHDNQLVRYYETVSKDFPKHKCIGVYYKIGFQSDMRNVTEAKYIVCDRKSILSILEKYITQTQNSIFQDYYEYLNGFDSKAAAYKTLPVSKWEWEQINGFYKYCQDHILDTGLNIDFGYIHNPSGGFYGMWLWKPIYIDADGLKCEIYLQCEFSNGELSICYRASNKDDINKEEKINKRNREAMIRKHTNGVNIAQKHHFAKPPRYGTGKSVTLGKYTATMNTYEEATAAIKSAIEDFYGLIDELK